MACFTKASAASSDGESNAETLRFSTSAAASSSAESGCRFISGRIQDTKKTARTPSTSTTSTIVHARITFIRWRSPGAAFLFTRPATAPASPHAYPSATRAVHTRNLAETRSISGRTIETLGPHGPL